MRFSPSLRISACYGQLVDTFRNKYTEKKAYNSQYLFLIIYARNCLDFFQDIFPSAKNTQKVINNRKETNTISKDVNPLVKYTPVWILELRSFGPQGCALIWILTPSPESTPHPWTKSSRRNFDCYSKGCEFESRSQHSYTHPKTHEVGERLCFWASANTYTWASINTWELRCSGVRVF